jgi:hypothetical protein
MRTKSSGRVATGVVELDERFADDLAVLLDGAAWVTSVGEGERRLFPVDLINVGSVFGKQSGSYSGIGSMCRLNCRGIVES